ncbi:MAG TPA: ComF family protein [Candidatus Limnocylindria bacterium]|nr:ComF family protein [Candidatus Limnocylindria bacterium]
MIELVHAVRDVLLVPRCAGCGEPGAWFCFACRDLCDPVSHGGPLPVRGAGTYAGPLRGALHRLKYGGERGLADDLGALVALEVARDLARGIVLDAVVPVPLHRARALSRGYDQAALLAQAVAIRTGLPLRLPLRRVRAGRPQVELDRAARAANVRSAFVAEAGSLRRLRVALVDDVATTGATIADAAAAARAAGARAMRAYVVAVDA